MRGFFPMISPQTTEIIFLCLSGAAGSLMRLVVNDQKLQLPKFDGGNLYLGALGSIFVGAALGGIIDHSYITAFTAAYTGASITSKLIPPLISTPNNAVESVEDIMKRVCTARNVPYDIAYKVAKCESGLRRDAINVNTTGSRDRGLYQINDKYHPDVIDAQAFDPEFAINWFCDAYLAGKLDAYWSASKKCWGV